MMAGATISSPIGARLGAPARSAFGGEDVAPHFGPAGAAVHSCRPGRRGPAPGAGCAARPGCGALSQKTLVIRRPAWASSGVRRAARKARTGVAEGQVFGRQFKLHPDHLADAGAA